MSSTPVTLQDLMKRPEINDPKLFPCLEAHLIDLHNRYFPRNGTMFAEVVWVNDRMIAFKRLFLERHNRTRPGWFLRELVCPRGVFRSDRVLAPYDSYRTVWELEFKCDDDDKCYEIRGHPYDKIPFHDYDQDDPADPRE